MPTNVMVRLRFNPLFSYEENRIDSFLALSPGDATPQAFAELRR